MLSSASSFLYSYFQIQGIFCLSRAEEAISETALLKLNAYFSAHEYLEVSYTQRLFVMLRSWDMCEVFFFLIHAVFS